MKRITFSCLAAVILLQLIPVNGNARDIRNQKEKNNRTEIKQDTISAVHSASRPGKDISGTASSSPKKEGEEGERNVMLNASDANKPREIQIGLPSEDVNVYENGLPAVYSSAVHKLAAHWRSDSSLGEVGLLSPSESAITTGNIAYSVNAFSKLGQKDFQGILNYRANHFGMQNFDLNVSGGISDQWLYTADIYQIHELCRPDGNLSCRSDAPLQRRTRKNISALQTFAEQESRQLCQCGSFHLRRRRIGQGSGRIQAGYQLVCSAKRFFPIHGRYGRKDENMESE